MKDLISIIVPVYNVENYLKECLDSILNQTYQNIEVIIIDDGSTDNSSKICDEYAKKDKRIQVIHQQNSGLSVARNNGIKLSKGKYLSFIDSDDIIHSQMIELLNQEIKKNKCDISICKYQSFTDKYIEKQVEYKVKIMNQFEFLKNLMIDKEISSHACNKLYKKELFKKVTYPVGKKYEDIGTTYKLGLNADSICYLNIELYGYRVRQNSIVNNLKKETLLDSIDMINKRYNDLINKRPELKDYIDMNRINTTTRYFLEIIRNNQKSLLKDNDITEKLNEELLISKKLIRKETKKINTLKQNIANYILIISPKLFFITMNLFYKLKTKGVKK